jgi:very-short-patch-repair endonuclease
MSAAKDRLVQTFRFLKELNELRNPVARDLSHSSQLFWIDEWPSHPFITVRRGDRAEENEESGEGELEPLIRIRRANLTSCPRPPEGLDGWLKPGWQSVEGSAEVLPRRNFSHEEKGSFSVTFEDDHNRVTAFDAWRAARANWIDAERPSVNARKLFENIHALWSSLQRESDTLELVLGEGILNVPSESIRHPVLLQRINLQFDPAGPEFRFDAGTERSELYRALLRLIPAVEGRMIAQFDRDLDAAAVEPLGGLSTAGYLRRLVQGLFAADGEFLEDNAGDASAARPTLRRKPVIFVRLRNAGLATTLDHIVEDLAQDGTTPPEGLSRIVGVEAGGPAISIGSSNSSDHAPSTHQPTVDPDILFSKPANAEQYEIAARLAKAKAVLVQGPPGTGKTHTIANLLGCLLAQGKTVLVTAHTTKALRVLRDKVDDALKSLCLSVLDSDAESQEQLKLAAGVIAARLSTTDAPALRRDAGILREKRTKLLETEADLLRRLRDARFSEVEEFVIGGEGFNPIEVAKRVKAEEAINAWIPQPVRQQNVCPLTEAEIGQLYATNTVLAAWDESQLSVSQPLLSEIVAPSDFRLRAAEKAAEEERAKSNRPELWDAGAVQKVRAEELQDIHQRVKASSVVLGEKLPWLREVLFAGWAGGDLSETWRDLLRAIERVVTDAGATDRLVADYGAELPRDTPLETLVATVDEILEFLKDGGLFGLKTRLTKRNWHAFLENCRIDPKSPRFAEKLRALRAKAQLELARGQLAARWSRLVTSHGGPAIDTVGKRPERTAQVYVPKILERLDWRTTVWQPLIAELFAKGFRWQQWLAEHSPMPGDHGELTRLEQAVSDGLAEVFNAQVALIRQRELTAAISRQRTYLAGFPQSEVASVLLQAQDDWDVKTYEEACHDLARLERLRETYATRVQLVARLQTAAPKWAEAIAKRDGPHGNSQPTGDPITAWRWRQWHDELERRGAVSISDLQDRLQSIRNELRETAAQIIELETWAAQRERTALQAQQALMGYVQTIRRIGKGTGKRVPDLLRQARSLLAIARRAVPVWIMPLSRVYESFDPRETRFDVVIIDEASQSDVTALAALYFGHEHVVVGDNEQVTPDAVGQRLDQVQRLIDTNLQGIPNSELYDGQTSIYDLAEGAFGGVVALREHFRCVPEIIQFSNHLSYNLQIRPLREPISAPIRPALVPHRVTGYRAGSGKTNPIEALEIASLIVACIEDASYGLNECGEPTTFGVISLLGVEQALMIEEILRHRLDPVTFIKHRVLCGNAAQFQGDERDVIFLSMVDGPPDDGQLSLREDGTRGMYKKRYNVAVSRAKNQLWLIHSLDPNVHLKPRDLRRRLIEHVRDPEVLMRASDVDGKRTHSFFEKAVLQHLIAAGYRVQTQWPVGAYRIDLVVEGQTQRLAVECDGEKWHTPEHVQRDIERQTVLERLGWNFIRIRGSLFFRNPVAAMATVFVKLDQLGIEPLGQTASSDPGDLVDRVRRRAEILRQEWKGEADGSEEPTTVPESDGGPIAVPSVKTEPQPQAVPSTSTTSNGPILAVRQVPPTRKTNAPKTNNRVVDELYKMYPQFQNPTCPGCTRVARLEIADEGIVVFCTACKERNRVDVDTLQHLAEQISARCFSCDTNRLKSTAKAYGNVLMCQNPECGMKNTWRGINDRF